MKLKLTAFVNQKGAVGQPGDEVDCKDTKLAKELVARGCATEVGNQEKEAKA